MLRSKPQSGAVLAAIAFVMSSGLFVGLLFAQTGSPMFDCSAGTPGCGATVPGINCWGTCEQCMGSCVQSTTTQSHCLNSGTTYSQCNNITTSCGMNNTTWVNDCSKVCTCGLTGSVTIDCTYGNSYIWCYGLY